MYSNNKHKNLEEFKTGEWLLEGVKELEKLLIFI